MIDEINTTDEAFLSAVVPNRIEDLELKPYGIMRQTVAMSLGVRNTDPVDAFFESVIMVWLCTLNEEQVLEAQSNKLKAKKEAFEWADKRGYSFTNFQPLLDFYKKTLDQMIHSSNAVLAGDNGEPEKNSGEQRVL
jgi:hypothetical protein